MNDVRMGSAFASHIFFVGEKMFVLENSLQFVNVDIDYLKKLHEVCSEVHYKPYGYENKPFLGILINQNDKKYVIPFTSAKPKHKFWKNSEKDCFVISFITDKKYITKNSVWLPYNDNQVKLLLSVLDVKKMIPIKEGVFSKVDLNISINDNQNIIKYKNFMKKEYWFCLKIIPEILNRASKIYDRQMRTGKIIPFCCDFKLLEKTCDEY